jgi:hypothetical protein
MVLEKRKKLYKKVVQKGAYLDCGLGFPPLKIKIMYRILLCPSAIVVVALFSFSFCPKITTYFFMKLHN